MRSMGEGSCGPPLIPRHAKDARLETDQQSAHSPNRRIALLIDADNVSHTKIAAMLAELSKYGTANIRRAYGDWAATGLKGWTSKLHDFAIRPIQQFTYSTGKNATDIALVIDAMELLYTQKLDAFCIASSDADFTPLVMQLKANGHEVYGFGEAKTPAPFVNACTTFVYLDRLEDPALAAEAATAPRSTPARTRAAAPESAESAVAKPGRKLAQDTKLVTLLRGAVEAAAREDGWAAMSAAGSAAKRQAPIDPRNYGVRNFPALFEATGLFDIFKGEGGQTFVADKRNKDRTERPVR
jgi:uncharacterized protein (TIGR00288 family)